MKRILVALIALFILLSACLPVSAAFENPPVVDGAGYLSQAELEDLSTRVNAVREKYGFEVAIYTQAELYSSNAQASADDIYDDYGYGSGANDDGILLYICRCTREYHMTTHGKGLEYFNTNGLIYLEDKLLPYLEMDLYYEAFVAYIDTAEELLEMAYSGEPYNEQPRSTEYVLFVIFGCLLLPLIIAFLMMYGKLSKMKTAVENNYAENYIKPGSKRLDGQRDIFLYSNLIRTARPKANSGSHTSASGRTHGGRGGSF